MADIQPGNVHYDIPLANLAVGWTSPALIGRELMPVVPAPIQSGKYIVFPRGEERIENDTLGLDDYPKMDSSGFSDDTYACEDHARGDFLNDKTAANANTVATQRVVSQGRAVLRLTRKLMINHEQAVATALSDASAYRSSLTQDFDSGAANFDLDDHNGIHIIRGFADEMELQTGFRPNTLTIARDAWTRAMKDPNFLANFSQNVPTPQQVMAWLAAAVEVDRVLIAGATMNTADKGQTPVMARLWQSNAMWLTYNEPGVEWETPALGKTFAWQLPGRGADGFAVKLTRDERRGGGGTHIDVFFGYDVKVTSKDENGKILGGAYLRNVWSDI